MGWQDGVMCYHLSADYFPLVPFHILKCFILLKPKQFANANNSFIQFKPFTILFNGVEHVEKNMIPVLT